MSPSDVAQTFHENGYAVVRGVFSQEEVSSMERHLQTLLRETVPRLAAGDVYFEDSPDKPVKHLVRLHEHSDFFRVLLHDKRVLAIMQAIWPDTEIVPDGVSFFGKPARSGSVTPAHQDNAFQNWQPPEELVCTIAIDESTAANGALSVQKGSHLLGRLPHRPSGVMGFSQTLCTPLDSAKYPTVQLCMQPGDVCLHHTNTIHFSGANNTDRSRRQLGLQYRSARAQRDEEGWAKYQQDLKALHEQHAVT